MQISRYGVTLKQVDASHLEMLREWRNDRKIARFMFYKGEITAIMQQEWFQSVNNEQNFFFVIYKHQKPVGLINISSIDWEKKTAYTGLFIYDDVCIGTDVPVSASLAMLDVFFIIFDLQLAYAKVKGDNKVAHRYNTMLGFMRTKKIELGLGYEYVLNAQTYLLEANKMRSAAMRVHGNKTIVHLQQNNFVDAFVFDRLKRVSPDVLKNLEVTVSGDFPAI